MLGRVKTLDHHLLTRRCLDCGYDGALLRGGHAPHCPRCGCDLQKRPARSYAEMEGLLGQEGLLAQSLITIDPVEAPIDDAGVEDRLIHRWLIFLFMLLMGLIAIAYLAAAALAV